MVKEETPTPAFENPSMEPSSALDELPRTPAGGSFRSGQRTSREDIRGNRKSRGARGGRNKRSDMGRAEWSRAGPDKRARHEENQQAAKRRRLDGEEPVLPIYATQFTKEEIESEPKRPKRKVAVMIGYSGTGYKGMQLNHNERTIEGDLFMAFVGAGAISKANADDPKKSGLIRCARTDKGVHAAGNLVSLKLIVEDPDIISKINEKLSPQIRVFGIERTNGSFSAYQFCDSRIYEYLIPTHCFLPPHPSSYLAKKLGKLAEEANDIKGYEERQEEVSSYWAEVEEKYIRPVLEHMDPSIRSLVQRALYDISVKEAEDELTKTSNMGPDQMGDTILKDKFDAGLEHDSTSIKAANEIAAIDSIRIEANADTLNGRKASNDAPEVTLMNIDEHEISGDVKNDSEAREDEAQTTNDVHEISDRSSAAADSVSKVGKMKDESEIPHPKPISPLEIATRQLRSTYVNAKKAYRIHPRRLERVRSALSRYIGTQNFHNYTIEKSHRDASAKRVIKSFTVSSDPIIIGDTEWLSLKVHGQSFMMHQIRKMVSMVALVVRCGCHEGRMQDSYMANKISIPKAPGLGLLLERPVFDTYNERLVGQLDRAPIDFSKYEKEMQDFKQKEIYERIFREEERDNTFHSFFAAIDNLKSSRLLYLSSGGLAATKDDTESGASKPAGGNDETLIESDVDEERTLVDDDDGGSYK